MYTKIVDAQVNDGTAKTFITKVEFKYCVRIKE